jgi:hypothetical protein
VHLPFPDELTQLTSLTKLVMDNSRLGQHVPPAVWALTQLRHLSMNCCGDLEDLSPQISSLKQLTYLDIGDTQWDSAASDLAAWLPQLEVLAMEKVPTWVGPRELTHLTRLTSLTCSATSAAAVDGLGQLKEAHLNVVGAFLVPPLSPFGSLSALEVLSLRVKAGSVPLGPCLLPSLRRLELSADNPVYVAQHLVGSALHLTHLEIITYGQQQEGAILQLGSLPVLQELRCNSMDLAGAGPWLQQHSHLTSLHIYIPEDSEEVVVLDQLPTQLQLLCLGGSIGRIDVSEAVVQLKGLRVLDFGSEDCRQLPSWVSQLSALEVLDAFECSFRTGWEALAQLPLLRRFDTGSRACIGPLLCAAPHLCWAPDTYYMLPKAGDVVASDVAHLWGVDASVQDEQDGAAGGDEESWEEEGGEDDSEEWEEWEEEL